MKKYVFIILLLLCFESYGSDTPTKAEVIATMDLALGYSQKCAANWQFGKDSNYYKGACQKFWAEYKKLPAHIEAIKKGTVVLEDYERDSYQTYLDAVKVQVIKIKSYQQ